MFVCEPVDQSAGVYVCVLQQRGEIEQSKMGGECLRF